jgi:hypothetical protein
LKKGREEQFEEIKRKQTARHRCPAYKDCYAWSKITDKDIDFLIEYAEELRQWRDLGTST